LVDGKITTKEYKDILKDNGINPQAEEINKHLRILERGDVIKYNELQFAVNKYKNSYF
jgi:Ca2+-binding EF-hand superfamily protein